MCAKNPTDYDLLIKIPKCEKQVTTRSILCNLKWSIYEYISKRKHKQSTEHVLYLYLKKNITASSSGFAALSVLITSAFDASEIKIWMSQNMFPTHASPWGVVIYEDVRVVPLGKSISWNPWRIKSWQSVGRWYWSAVAKAIHCIISCRGTQGLI